MNLKRLRYFCAVAEELHFGRAAARLHMAQPPLSQQIRQLESELKLKLFERTTRRVVLTGAGRDVYAEATRLLAEADLFERRVTEIQSGEGGRLRIGFVDSASYDIMPRFLRAHRAEWPAVDYELRSMSSDEQLAAVVGGQIDLGLCRTTSNNQQVNSTVIANEALVVAVPSDHRLANQQSTSLNQLVEESFIGFDRLVSPSLHQEIVALFAQRSISYDPIIEATEYATILGLVAAGQGIAIVPSSVQTLDLPSLNYLQLRDKDATISLLLLSRQQERSVVVQQAVKLARVIYKI